MNRLKTTKLLAAFFAMTMLVASLVTGVWAAPAYTVTWLGLLDDNGNTSLATGINRDGRVTGWSGQMDGSILTWSKPFVWDKATGMVGTGTLGGTSGQAADINNFGQVVGWSNDALRYEHAFLYDNGAMTAILGAVAGRHDYAYGINNSGKIAGHGMVFPGALMVAYIYDGTRHNLPTLTPAGGLQLDYAYDINDLDQVVGSSYGRAAIWDNGQVRDMGTPGELPSLAWAINNAGQAVGYYYMEGYKKRAFLYANGSLTDLPTFAGGESEAYGINNLGHVVGWSDGAPFLYRNGVLTDIRGLVSLPFGDRVDAIVDINDTGQMVGWGVKNGMRQAVLVSPYVAPTADMTVKVTDAPDPVVVGNNLTYTITVHNNGPETAGVTVADTLPAGVTWQSISSLQATCNVIGGISCTVAGLAPGSDATITLVVKPNASGSITNTVTLSGDFNDPDMTNNTASAVTRVNNPVSLAADLAVTMQDEPDPAVKGETLVYKILLTNSGPGTATGIKLTDTLPAGVVLTSYEGSGTCYANGSSLSCSLKDITAGGTAELKFLTKPTIAGNFSNTVSVTSTAADPNTADNKATVSTTVR